LIISRNKFASLALVGEAQYQIVSLETANMEKHLITSLTILLLTCPAFGVEQLELLEPSESKKCIRCDRPDNDNNYNKLARDLLTTDNKILKKSNYFEMRKATLDKETPKRFMGGDNSCNTVLPNGHIIIKDC
jgi:hypothetical protein|tara:strand:+ start:51 stop:449 length:399 start_codon:yes stop_codon:yes gene_type:complete